MSFQETKSVSWFERIKNSFAGVIVGLALVVAMVVLLFWNEGRAVQTARSLAEGAGLVVSVEADTVDPAREGQLIHVSGPLVAASPLVDQEFAIGAQGVRLVRKVEMFQWIESTKTETKTKLGGGQEQVTTYSYDTGWSSRSHDSSRFKVPEGHQNPTMVVGSATFQIDSATLGAFTLDQNVIGLIGGERDMPVQPSQADAVQQGVGAGIRASIVDGDIYLGPNPHTPRVGDYRISYRLANPGTVSVIGRQTGSGFAPYQTQAGNALLMFDNAMSSNTLLTWIVRLAGIGLLVFGFALILGPLGVIADVIPFVGWIVRMGTGIVALIAGVLVGTATIALAWFFYRPFTALVVLAIGVAVSFVIPRLVKRRGASVPQLGDDAAQA
jgi:hypothetical protein